MILSSNTFFLIPLFFPLQISRHLLMTTNQTRPVNKVRISKRKAIVRPNAPSLDQLLEKKLGDPKNDNEKKTFGLVRFLKRCWRLHKIIQTDEWKIKRRIRELGVELERTKKSGDSTKVYEIERKLKKGNNHLDIIKYHGLTKYVHGKFVPRVPINFQWSRRSTSSKRIGTRVHRELKEWFNLGFIKLKCLGEGSWQRVHRFTKKALVYLHDKDLRILSSEIPLHSPKKRIIGWIDAIGLRMVDGEIRTVLIDWKTGFENQDDEFGKLNYPFRDIGATNRGKYTIQMATMFMICKREYGIVFDEILLIQISDDFCGEVALHSEIWNAKERLYDHLKDF